MSDEKPRVMIGVPTYGNIADRLYENLAHTASHAIDNGIEIIGAKLVFNYWQRGSSIPTNRHKICEVAEKVKADYVLMVDSDMAQIPDDAIVRLVNHKKPLVGALYFAKQPPCVPIASRRDRKGNYVPIINYEKEETTGGLLSVDGIGFGMVLLSIPMIQKIMEVKGDRPLFNMHETKGEDYWFCELAKEAGFPVFVDVGLEIGHRGEYTYTSVDLHRFKPLVEEIKEKYEKSTLDAINAVVRQFNTW